MLRAKFKIIGLLIPRNYFKGLNSILKHFRNAPLYILLYLQHALVEDIFLVIFHVRVQ